MSHRSSSRPRGDRGEAVDWEASRLRGMTMASRANHSRIAPGLGGREVLVPGNGANGCTNTSSKNAALLSQVATMLGEAEDPPRPEQQHGQHGQQHGQGQHPPGGVGRFLRSLTPTGRAGRERAADASPLRPTRASPPTSQRWAGRNFTPSRTRVAPQPNHHHQQTSSQKQPPPPPPPVPQDGNNGGWAGRNFTPTRSRQSALSPTKPKEKELRGGAREREGTPTRIRGAAARTHATASRPRGTQRPSASLKTRGSSPEPNVVVVSSSFERQTLRASSPMPCRGNGMRAPSPALRRPHGGAAGAGMGHRLQPMPPMKATALMRQASPMRAPSPMRGASPFRRS